MVTNLLDCLGTLMKGDGNIDMHEHGLTSDEECAALMEDHWPMVEDAANEGAVFPAGAGAACSQHFPCFQLRVCGGRHSDSDNPAYTGS